MLDKSLLDDKTHKKICGHKRFILNYLESFVS